MEILIEKYLRKNSAYRNNGVNYDEGNEKWKKTVISDSSFFNLSSQIFFDLKFAIFGFSKIPKYANFTELAVELRALPQHPHQRWLVENAFRSVYLKVNFINKLIKQQSLNLAQLNPSLFIPFVIIKYLIQHVS